MLSENIDYAPIMRTEFVANSSLYGLFTFCVMRYLSVIDKLDGIRFLWSLLKSQNELVRLHLVAIVVHSTVCT